MTSPGSGRHGTTPSPTTPPTVTRTCDVAVVGGSVAGLSAALQLVRHRRSVLVVDDGTPGDAPAAPVRGVLGHEGVPAADLLARGRAQVRGHGGEVLTGRVLAVRAEPAGGFHLALSGGFGLRARRVVVATGSVEEPPAVAGLRERWGGRVLPCPSCDGYEVGDRRVVQVVTSAASLRSASLLRHLTDRLTVVLHGASDLDRDGVAALAAAGVPVLGSDLTRVGDGEDGALVVELADGTVLTADAVLTGTRCSPRTQALDGLGVRTAPHPGGLGDVLVVDPAGRTGVAGVFAAGGVVDPGRGVLDAAADGGRVGARVALDLAAEDLAAGVRSPAAQVEWDDRYDHERVWSGNPNGTLVAEAGALDPGRALDVGAGEGADALWLAEHGWDVTASDVSERALARVRAEADRRGVAVRTLHRDATDLAGYDGRTYDLVSLQYGAFGRTPDRRGQRNLLDAVAVGGTLLVVGHAPDRSAGPVDPAERTVPWDALAYVGVEEIAAAVGGSGDWRVEVHETRPRPAGAVSAHHVEDVVLRAVRTGPPPAPR